MKRPLLFKSLAIALLMLLLLIPIGMIGNSIDERKAYSETVVNDIARSSSYSQTLAGPVLVVPYNKTIHIWRSNEKQERYIEESIKEGELYFLPELYRVNSDMTTELRARGIYKALLYHTNNQIDGEFSLPANYGITENLEDYQFSTPYVAMGISDIRGIKNALKLTFNNQEFGMQPGTRLKKLGNGVHAVLENLQSAEDRLIKFSFSLVLQGTGQLNVVPVGKETHVDLHSDWPHPSFVGDFLPASHDITNAGFRAHWQTSYFSTNFAEHFYACMEQLDCGQYGQLQFGVNLVDPVNQYVKSDRAIKYALLFIALTFAGFFLFEILKRLQVHPMQYGLVGLALAFFYLLLLSLSEHIGFALAYGISSTACVLLIGFYVSHVLQSVIRGVGFTLGLATLYGLLYGLLSAEDYALLMGSLLLFVVLGAFMALTRKVNWYAIGNSKTAVEDV